MKIDRNYPIYIVDDDRPLNGMIYKFLEKKGFKNIRSFYTGEEELNAVTEKETPIIIQDFELPGMNGIDLLKKIKKSNSEIDFIFLSGQSSIEIAVEAIKHGAFDYIVKDNFARENVHTKIVNLLKIKSLKKDRIMFKYLMVFFFVMLIASWLSVFTLFYHK